MIPVAGNALPTGNQAGRNAAYFNDTTCFDGQITYNYRHYEDYLVQPDLKVNTEWAVENKHTYRFFNTLNLILT